MPTDVGKLSSYFTKKREDKSSGTRNTRDGSGKSISSVRARLENKLHVQQKTGFAFNFAVECDAANLQEEAPGGTSAAKKGLFRFGFNPSDTNDASVGTPTQNQGSAGGDGADPRADQDFSIEIEQRRAQPQGKNKPKRKRGGKKKKGGKGKGKAAEHNPRQDLKAQPSEPAATPGPSTTVGDGGEITSNSSPGPVAEAKYSSPNQGFGTATPDVTKIDDVGARRERAPLRPPPGFTLESWKDPALSGEERRRRRFGSGVRNMAAIQRRCDARRELAANDDVEIEVIHLPSGDQEASRGVESAEAGIPVDSPGGAAGGSSVFAFGFDIGISFDGGN